uniref:Uncharacterized protein n=1 Tax=Candidatus Kentrum sp. LFY TaxID=2126342 RepID=A0A450UFP8_9GAMM|nr:MAG: hypothetical protein BECKLFY1418A_GA0070994_101537 [Candidatus Kentron sp. LFY]
MFPFCPRYSLCPNPALRTIHSASCITEKHLLVAARNLGIESVPREEQIDQEKGHFWMVGLDVGRRFLFIELVVIGGTCHASIKLAEALRADNSGWQCGRAPSVPSRSAITGA